MNYSDNDTSRPRAVAFAEASSSPGSRAEAKPLAIAAAAFLIGAVLVLIVGFADTAAVHDAAHDTRHSLAFPCH